MTPSKLDKHALTVSENIVFMRRNSSSICIDSTDCLSLRKVKVTDSPSFDKIKAFLSFFKAHFYLSRRTALAIGAAAIIVGLIAFFVNFGLSSLASACLITGGATLILSSVYHTDTVALCKNCEGAVAELEIEAGAEIEPL